MKFLACKTYVMNRGARAIFPRVMFGPNFFLKIPDPSVILFITWLFLSGCAEQPIPQLDAALHALEEARTSGAEDYAIEVFTEAEVAYLQAQHALDQERDRLEFFRNYQPVTSLLEKALTSAVQAKREAIVNKEEAKSNATAALALASKQIQQVRILLAEPSHPIPDQGFLEQLTLAFHETENLLAETQSIMTEENFIAVMTTAHSVESNATRIQEQIISARHSAAKRHV